MKRTSVSKLAAALFVAALSLGFAACSDDDENNAENYDFSFTEHSDVPYTLDQAQELLTGQWHLVGLLPTPEEVEKEEPATPRAARLQGIADGLVPVRYPKGVDQIIIEFQEDGDIYQIHHHDANGGRDFIAEEYTGRQVGWFWQIRCYEDAEPPFWSLNYTSALPPQPLKATAARLIKRLSPTTLILDTQCYIRVKEPVEYSTEEEMEEK